MARKLDVPHSTVQGWKNRQNIPVDHYDDILATATELDISLNIRPETADVTRDQIKRNKEKRKKRERDWIKSRILPFAGGVVASAMIIGLFLLPSYIDLTPQPMEKQELVTAPSSDKNPLTKFFDGLETITKNARAIKDTTKIISTAGQQAMTNDRPASERLAQLERDLQPAKGKYEAVDNLIAKLEAANRFFYSGQAGPQETKRLTLVDRSVEEMNDRFANQQLSQPEIQDILARFQSDPTSPTGQMLRGIEKQDLTAAAMLIGMTQLRSALNRSAPFDDDLELLKKITGEHPEIQESLSKLAPYSKTGVLTPAGMGNQVKQLSGDVLAARMQGDELAIGDRINNQLQLIQRTGNNNDARTQAIVNRVKQKLDNGNLNGALADLQSIAGTQNKDNGTTTLADALLAKRVGEDIANQIARQIADSLGTPFVKEFTMPDRNHRNALQIMPAN
jgi:hypothetical protein